jgi:hypothetical protein
MSVDEDEMTRPRSAKVPNRERATTNAQRWTAQ